MSKQPSETKEDLSTLQMRLLELEIDLNFSHNVLVDSLAMERDLVGC